MPQRLFGSLQLQFLALVALATLFPTAIVAYHATSNVADAQAAALDYSRGIARLAASDIEQRLDQVTAISYTLATLPGLLEGTDEHRDGALKAMATHRAGFEFLRYFTADLVEHGSSYHEQARVRADLRGRVYAEQAVATGMLTLTDAPVRAGGAGSLAVLPVVAPIYTGESDMPRGFLLASLQLNRLAIIWDNVDLPAGSTIVLIDTRRGRVLGTAASAGALVDTPIADSVLEHVRTGSRAAEVVTDTGERRLIAWDEVDDTPWVVAVDTPSQVVLAPIYVTAARQLLSAFAAIGVTATVLLVFWRQLAMRLRALQRAAEEWASARWDHRVDLRGNDEIAHLGRALNHMAIQNQQLARGERMRALGQLAGGVAHDLNQSLLLVTAYCDLARQSLEQPTPDLEDVREMFDIASRAALDGGDIVKRLLTFARTPADSDAERVDVARLLHDVAQLTSPRWRVGSKQGASIDLHVECPDGLAIDGWPSSLREALTNLIFNAIDALPSGGTIRLRGSNEDETVRIAVIDDGRGMPPEVQERAFEPFFSTKGEHGTGLGLAQVFSVVERHQGRIGVHSAVGVGTTFSLVFPGSRTLPIAAPVMSTGPLPARAFRVLAVDDEPLVGRVVQRALRRLGHEVIVTESAAEALEQLAASDFDAVVSDLGLGNGMDGWGLAEEVRRRWPHVRFVLASGWAAQIDIDEARSRGVAAVIAKPYRPADLARVVTGGDEPHARAA